jgi:hypothetical protein
LVSEGTPLFRVVDQKLEGIYVEAKATLVSSKMARETLAKVVENAKKQSEIVAKSLSGDLAAAKAGVGIAATELEEGGI